MTGMEAGAGGRKQESTGSGASLCTLILPPSSALTPPQSSQTAPRNEDQVFKYPSLLGTSLIKPPEGHEVKDTTNKSTNKKKNGKM